MRFLSSWLGFGTSITVCPLLVVCHRDPSAMTSLLRLSWGMYSDLITADVEMGAPRGDPKASALHDSLQVRAALTLRVRTRMCADSSHYSGMSA